MSAAIVAGVSLAYMGMQGLCLGQARHFKQLSGGHARPSLCLVLRLGGWLCFLGCLASCVAAWGWPMGTVGCMGMISVSGMLTTLLLTYLPRIAVALASLVLLLIAVGSMVL